MNILIAVSNMSVANGGVNTHIIDLCNDFLKRGMYVVLVTDSNNCDYKSRLEQFQQFNNFKCIFWDFNNINSSPQRLLATAKKFASIIKEDKINIMHMHSQSLCVVGALVKLKTGIPYIWTNHIDEIAHPKIFKLILRTLKFPIISVSSDLKSMLIKKYGINGNRITTVNNGIDLERFSPPALSSQEHRQLIEAFHCQGKYVVGLLARMTYGKGHMYLLQAVDIIQKRYNISNIKILIAGKVHDNEIAYRDTLSDYATQHNIDVAFLGF